MYIIQTHGKNGSGESMIQYAQFDTQDFTWRVTSGIGSATIISDATEAFGIATGVEPIKNMNPVILKVFVSPVSVTEMLDEIKTELTRMTNRYEEV